MEVQTARLEAKLTPASIPTPSDQSCCASMPSGAEPWNLVAFPLPTLTTHGAVLAPAAAEGRKKCKPGTALKEYDYMGLSSVKTLPSASVQVSFYSNAAVEKKMRLSLDCSETELRLGIGPLEGVAEGIHEGEKQGAADKDCKASVKQQADAAADNAMPFPGHEKIERRSAANPGFLQGSEANEVFHVCKEEMPHEGLSAEEKKQGMLKQAYGVSTVQSKQWHPLWRLQPRALDMTFQHGHELPSPPTNTIAPAPAPVPAANQSLRQSQAFRSTIQGFKPLPNQDVVNTPQHDAGNWSKYGFYSAAKFATPQPKNTIAMKRGFLEALSPVIRKNGAHTDSMCDMVGKIQGTQGVTVANRPAAPKGMRCHSPSLPFPDRGDAIRVPAGWKASIEQTKGGYGAMSPISSVPGTTTTWAPKVETENCEVPSASSHGFKQEEVENTSFRAPVVGWPPVQSFRKNTLVSHQKPVSAVAEEKGKSSLSPLADAPKTTAPSGSKLFVKTNMDGVPIGRKVNLKAYDGYESLKLRLQDLFLHFINGYTSGQGPLAAEAKKLDLLHGCDYVLTYEDNVGDWLLAGDVPWGMFVSSVKRLRVMKSSNATGLGRRSILKPK